MYLINNLTKYTVCLIILILTTSCRDDSSRDIINFKNKPEEVRDSIVQMNSLMDKLDFPTDPGIIKSWFFVNDSIIDINGARYNFNKSKPEHFTVLNTLSSKDEFLNLINYLRDNGLTSCRRDCSMSYNACGYYYGYKYDGSEPSNLRDIVLENPIYPKGKGYENNQFEILDQKKGLALLALTNR